MAKVLVVRKTDRTVHVVPIGNKHGLMALNNRLPVDMRMKFEEMEKEEALKLPFIDENYISPFAAQDKLKVVEGDLAEKDQQILALQAKIDALMKGDSSTSGPRALSAIETVELIGKAKTAKEVTAFLENESRKTVIDAISKKLSELSKN